MPSFTRKAIMQSFLKLVDQRPINKVTIKDIVEDCGINRNTFYYHFSDIPALIEAIVQEEAAELFKAHPTISSYEECIRLAIQEIQKNYPNTPAAKTADEFLVQYKEDLVNAGQFVDAANITSADQQP